MRDVMAWSRAMLLVAGAVLVTSVSIAEAVDVQGTWDAKFACTSYRNGFHLEKFNLAGAIQISQTGRALAINVAPFGDFAALESDDGVHTKKGVIGGGNCATFSHFGLFGSVDKVDAATGGGTMIINISGSADATEGPLKCHVTAKRISTDDPGVTPCP